MQRILGRNPRIPGLSISATPSELTESDNSNVLAHLRVIHETRQQYIAAEAATRVKDAIRRQLRPSPPIFSNVDEVFFLRDICGKRNWSGCATVIGQDRQCIILRMGGHIYRVAPERIRLAAPHDMRVTRRERG